jgi:hypothetical protein
MENDLRAALIAWLSNDPALAGINAIEEEAPVSASPPWLGIAASASTDWGTKDRPGREIRVALELESRTDLTSGDADLLGAIERRVLDLPPFHPGFEIASIRFLRARSEARADNRRAALIEFRFRLFIPIQE